MPSDAIQQIIGITTDVFQSPVSVKESFDPEFPGETYLVFSPVVNYGNAEILALEAEWRSRVIAAAPQCNGFRLLVRRQK